MVHEPYIVSTLALRGLDLNRMIGGLDDLAATVTPEGDDTHEMQDKQGASTFPLSSFGLSSCIDSGVQAIQVTAAWGCYGKVEIKLADRTTKRV